MTRLAHLAGQIRQGRFQRGMALLAGYFGVLSSIEAYFEHRRGSFNQRWMWTPVLLSVPMGAVAIGAVFSRRLARTMLPVVSGLTLLDGLIGFALHVRGIRRMPGHSRNLAFNVTAGPPLFAPLLFLVTGILGLSAALVRRELPWQA